MSGPSYSSIPANEASAVQREVSYPSFFTRVRAPRLSLTTRILVACGAAAVVGGSIGGAIAGAKKGSSGPTGVCAWSDYRLPSNFVPLNYSTTWTPATDGISFIAPFDFGGITSVDVRVAGSDASCALMHAVGLTDVSVSVMNLRSGAAVASASWRADAVNERLVIATGGVAPALNDVLRITLTYRAALGTSNVGLYASTFVNDSGATVTMLATQFEATAARRAFPCMDEPALKAAFALTLDGLPQGYTALGNMPVASTVPRAGGGSTVSFMTTPKMSTYLLALVAGPLINVTAPTAVGRGNIPVAAWAVARANNSRLLGYAVAAAAAIIPYYEDLFDVGFPLPKMDMVAIPDFAAGAMENWGLITYRETAMLANVTTSSSAELQRVLVVVAHELAHQWFGDIVTMAWWDALWLNEGFASRVEYLGTDFVDPGFSIDRQFLTSATLRALRADAFADAQQLTQSVTTSALVEGQFSAISYSKGAALIKMIQLYLDDQAANSLAPSNAFFSGVSAYLNKFAFGNAEPSALWSALADSSLNAPLKDWATTYEKQPGFPVVTLSWRDGDADAASLGAGVLLVSQARFFASPFSAASAAKVDASSASLLYWVPLSITAPAASLSSLPLSDTVTDARSVPFVSANWTQTIGSDLYKVNTSSWLKFNVNGSYYYRVNYPASLWTQLAAAANESASGVANGLTAADRATLLDDYMTFAESTAFRASGINTSAALIFAASLMQSEIAYEGVSVFLSHAGTLAALTVPDVAFASRGDTTVDPLGSGARACFTSASSFARSALAPAVALLGWTPVNGELPLITQLRSSVLSAASFFNDSATIAIARAKYDAGPSSLDANVAQLVLSSVVRWGGQAEWAAMKASFEATSLTDAATARRFLLALTASRDRQLLSDTLDYAFTDKVRVGDKVSVITAIAASPLGRDLAWVKAKANWAYLAKTYGAGGFDTSALVSSLLGNFQSQAYVDDVAAFWKNGADESISGATHDYSGALEAVGRSILWAKFESEPTCAWLLNNYK